MNILIVYVISIKKRFSKKNQNHNNLTAIEEKIWLTL